MSQTKISLSRLSYVIYEHPDFENFKTFAKEFGLVNAKENDGEIFYRGYGTDRFVYVARRAPSGGSKQFIGAGFVARSSGDFKAASQIQGAQTIDTSIRPGGGKAVSIPDPNGFEMQVIWDQEEQTIPAQGVSNCLGGHPMNGAIGKERIGKDDPLHLSRLLLIHGQANLQEWRMDQQ